MSLSPQDEEIARLRAELGRLMAELARLTTENAGLRAEMARLADHGAKMNERLAELLAIVQRKPGRSPKPAPAPVPPADLDAVAREAFENRPKAPELPARPKPEKKPRRPTGRKPLPEHLPADEHVLRPETCAQCGGTALDLADEVVETKLDVVKEHFRRRLVRRKTCRCRDCGARTTATSLPAPYARSKVTSAFLAWLVTMKFAMLVPLDRIRRDLATRGIALSMSFLVSLTEHAADLLAPVDGHHWRELLAGTWMATDGTGLKVLVPGLPGSHNGHIEVYRRDKTVVFQYEHDKGSEAVVNKLSTFTGTIVADAEHRYNAVFVDGRVVEAGCNAHGRRKFRDAEAVQPSLAVEGGAFIAAMFAAEARARERGLTGDALREWRQEKMRPLKAELATWMAAVKPTLVPSDPLLGVIAYYQNHWDALFRFVDNPELPLDNSGSEREFQTVAKLRFNMLFAGGTEGAHRAATLLGVVATCRAHGINPEQYLAWAFDRLGTHRAIFGLTAAQIVPAAYMKGASPSVG